MKQILNLFAEILEYPKAGLIEVVKECEKEAKAMNLDAGMLREFKVLVEETSFGRLEEIYTYTFDLNAACSPYVGSHLFGEGYNRSLFMLRLKEHYNMCNFQTGNELPDYLSVMLRFLTVCDKKDLQEEIVSDALLPALDQMIEKSESQNNNRQASQYNLVLKTLRLVLKEQLSKKKV